MGYQDYIIIKRFGDNEYSKWIVELPEDIFKEYNDDGGSTCGEAKEILEELPDDLQQIRY